MRLAQVELATLFGVSVQTIQKWSRDPTFPKPEKEGRKQLYEVQPCMEWWKNREIDKLVSEYGPKEEKRFDLEKERARLAAVQADRQALMLQKDRSELIPLDEVNTVFFAAGRAARDAFDSELRRRAASIAKASNAREVIVACQSFYREFHQAYCDRLEKFLEQHQQNAEPD